MYANINAEITLTGTSVHIYTISVNQSRTNKTKTYYQHRHPGFELHYIQSGECKVTCGGKSHAIQQGSLILIPPGIYHDVITTMDKTVRLCISFDMHRKDTTYAAKSNQDIFDRNTPAMAKLDNNDAAHILERIHQSLTNDSIDPFKNDKLSALCSSLLLELIPCLTGATTKNPHSQQSDKPEDRNYMIDSFIGTNFMHNNAKTRIASDLYISPRQLQRIIQKNYGMSYREKLAETRMQIAMDLLTNSETPIHKISEILGYSCSANFSAFIKRTTGKTPSQIRKER